VLLGAHARLYPFAVTVIPKREEGAENPSLDDIFYPVVSLEQLLGDDLPGADGERPGKALLPVLRFGVLVRTKEYRRLYDIPREITKHKHLEGRVVSIQSLGPKTVESLRKEYPTMDPAKVVIVETGRRLRFSWASLIWMGVGLVCLLRVFAAFGKDLWAWTQRLFGMMGV
jgi:hypothetical protein